MKKIAILLAALLIISASLVACNTVEEEDDNDGGKKTPTNVGGSETESTTSGEEETTTREPDYTFTDYTEDQTSSIYALSITSAVNLREQPSLANSVKKLSVENGTELTKIGESNESAVDEAGDTYKWFKVKYEDKVYYVKSTLTTTVTDPDEGFVATTKTLYLSTQALRVRIVPTTENPAAAFLNKGDEITVIAVNETTGWYKISYVGKWVSGEFYIPSDSKYFSETPIEDAE